MMLSDDGRDSEAGRIDWDVVETGSGSMVTDSSILISFLFNHLL